MHTELDQGQGHNPYEAPQAPVLAGPGPTRGVPHYYTMSPQKLIVMMLLTCGLYPLFWFYAHWKTVRDRFDEDIWPLPRALFGVVTYFELRTRLQRRLQEADIALPSGLVSAPLLYLVVSVGSNMTGRLETEPLTTAALNLVLLGMSTACLHPAQVAANAIAGAVGPGDYDNRAVTPMTILAVVLGLAVWAMMLMSGEEA